jgi:hypothetical protein
MLVFVSRPPVVLALPEHRLLRNLGFSAFVMTHAEWNGSLIVRQGGTSDFSRAQPTSSKTNHREDGPKPPLLQSP